MNKSTMLTVLVILLAMPISVNAWGISYENNDITLNMGESRLYYTNIQNMEDVEKNVTVLIVSDKEVLVSRLLGDEFLILQPKTKTPYYLNITASNIPGEYKIIVYYTSNPIGEGLTITTRKSITIDVKIREQEQQSQPQNHVPSSGSVGDGSIPSVTNGIQQPEVQGNMSANNETNTIQYHENTTNDEDAPILDESSGRGVGVIMGTSTDDNPILTVLIIVVVLSVVGFIVYKKDLIGKLDWI